MATTDYSNANSLGAVEGKHRAWRRNFNGTALDTSIWSATISAGMTATVSGGSLSVNMGTGINEETIIQSLQSFTIPFRVQWSHSLNQRVANQEIYLEVVNAAGTTYAGWMFDGVTNTLAKTTHMNGGNSNPASPTGTVTVATSGTSVIREIDARIDVVDFTDRAVDSTGQGTSRVTKTRTTLDPEEKYFVRMRFKNLGTAPTAGTINLFDTVIVQDTNDVLVEVGAGRGNAVTGRAIPITIVAGNVGLSNQTIGLAASATLGTTATATRLIGVTNASQSIKATAGRLYGWVITNPGASAVYCNFYNATAPTIGTTEPFVQILIPAGSSATYEMIYAINMTTAITVAATDISIPRSAVAPASTLSVTAFWI
jgi:hypothetical protein